MSGNKRKRTKNTTPEQYELYLSCMETDTPFRSGTNDPPDYVDKKWEELTIKLNALGDGPNLTVEEWKKRFGDWKYATRSKYRKLKIKSGTDNIKLSLMEERGMAIWGGKILTNYNGFELQSNSSNMPENETSDNDLYNYDPNSDVSDSEMIEINVDPLEVTNQMNESSPKHETDTSKRKKDIFNGTRQKLPLLMTETFTDANKEPVANDLNSIIKSFYERYIDVELEKIKLKKAKLAFEIAKYKYENTSFEFDL